MIRNATVFVCAALLGLAAGTVGGADRSLRAELSQSGHAEPGMPGARLLHLPAVRALAERDLCQGRLEVQSLGNEPSKVILVAFDRAGGCPPSANGPSGVECSGLLAPLGSWSFLGAQIRDGASSAQLYSITTRMLSELEIDMGFDDVTADLVCETLFFGIVGDADDHRRWQAAVKNGLTFAGIPLRKVMGAPIAGMVLRDCEGALNPDEVTSAAYLALPDDRTGEELSELESYRYRLPDARTASDGLGSHIYVQNAGLSCGLVVLSIRAHEDCETDSVICDERFASLGESLVWDLAACAEEGWRGSAELWSDVPLAIVHELAGEGLRAAASAIALEQDESGRIESSAAGPLLGAALLLAPSRSSELPQRICLEAGIVAVDPTEGGSYRMVLLDATGEELGQAPLLLCPGGSAVANLELDLPSGSQPPMPALLRIESEAGGARVDLAGSLTTTRYERDGGGRLSLQSQDLSPFGFQDTERASERALQAMTAMRLSLGVPGVATEIVVSNAITEGGSTDFGLYLIDYNDQRDYRCLSLPAGASTHIDLETDPELSGTFIGTLLISATGWQQPAPGGPDAGAAPALLSSIQTRRKAAEGAQALGDLYAAAAALPIGRHVERPERLLPTCPGDGSWPEPVEPGEHWSLEQARSRLLLLPMLDKLGAEAGCVSSLEVLNEGPENALLVAAFWAEPGLCPPICSGLAQVRCSGLIAPQGRWTLTWPRAVEPMGSAAIFSFSDITVSAAGGEASDRRLAAEIVCETLSQDALERCSGYRPFLSAFLGGTRAMGIDIGRTFGPPIQATLRRDCDLVQGGSRLQRELQAAARYPAQRFADAVAPARGSDPSQDSFAYHVPVLFADFEEQSSILSVQNAGGNCASVSLSFEALREAGFGEPQIFALSPGESRSFRVDERVTGPWVGLAVLRASAPLAIGIDHLSDSSLRSHLARSGELAFDIDDDGVVDQLDFAEVLHAQGAVPGNPKWRAVLDLDHNGRIDNADVYYFGLRLDREGISVPPTVVPTPAVDMLYIPSLHSGD